MSIKTEASSSSLQNSLVIFMFLSFTLTGLILPVRSEPPPEIVRLHWNKTANVQFLIPSSSAEHDKKPATTTTVSTPPAQLTKPPQDTVAHTHPEPDKESHRQSATNHWLQSILTHVDSLNLNNQQSEKTAAGDKRLTAEDEEDLLQQQQRYPEVANYSSQSVSSSEAPTDSGEDPLETSTLQEGADLNALPLVTLIQQQQMANATQYSIAVSNLAPSETGYDTTASSKVSLEQDDHITSNDGNRQLVESNNVSAVITLSESLANQNQINEQEALISSTLAPPKSPVSCEQAYTQCALRKVCAPALKSYNDDCQDLINNRTNQCSTKCLKAMIALRSSEEGDDMVRCDCQSNEYCLLRKQRSEACRPQVEEAVDPKTLVSCSTASWICLADQLCSTALEYYYRNCQSLFSQRHCSMRCNNSLSILYRQPKAQKLITCQCDGSEEFPCVRYKTYTERLCLNKPASSQMDSTITIDDNNDAQQAGSEEDSSNMTNDPESFILDPVNNDDDHNHDQDEYDENSKAVAESGAAVSEDSSSGYNGIQLLEDNWIPWMTSRYFTNLHQRQLAQQQQQQQQQRHQQQHSKQRHNRPQQLSSQQQSQQPRKSHKNAKQKTNKTNSSSCCHEVKRGRYGRILMLASSASSSSPSNRMVDMVSSWHTAITVVYSSSHILFTRFLLH